MLSNNRLTRSQQLRNNTILVKTLKRSLVFIFRPSVLLSEDKKSASILGPEEVGGLVFIDGEEDESIKKINLKISSSVSESISLGVGDVEKMKLVNFTLQRKSNII